MSFTFIQFPIKATAVQSKKLDRKFAKKKDIALDLHFLLLSHPQSKKSRWDRRSVSGHPGLHGPKNLHICILILSASRILEFRPFDLCACFQYKLFKSWSEKLPVDGLAVALPSPSLGLLARGHVLTQVDAW